MDLQLKGRRALVTGSSSGIGEATARMLAQEGCAVVVHGRNRQRADAVAAAIGAAGVATGELSSEAACAAVHDMARAALGGPIEILINNAGGGATGSNVKPPLDISIADWTKNLQANALSSVNLCLLAVPDMVSSGWGRVVNVSSAVAMQPNNLGSDYSGAKAALNNFTVSLAGSLKSSGVTINTVTPGVVFTDAMFRWGHAKLGPDATQQQIAQAMSAAGMFDLPPVGRLGTPEDIALIVTTLASPLSGYVTGSNYRVDGGQIRTV